MCDSHGLLTSQSRLLAHCSPSVVLLLCCLNERNECLALSGEYADCVTLTLSSRSRVESQPGLCCTSKDNSWRAVITKPHFLKLREMLIFPVNGLITSHQQQAATYKIQNVESVFHYSCNATAQKKCGIERKTRRTSARKPGDLSSSSRHIF